MQDQTCRKCGVFGPHRVPYICRACERQRRKAYRDANREKWRASQRAYKSRRVLRDPEWAKREYRHAEPIRKPRDPNLPKRDPEERRKQRQMRKEWLRQGCVTRQDLLRIYEAHSGKCAYCGIPVKARLNMGDVRGFDHVIPRVKGGTHTPDNLVVCCHKCNTAKGIK